MKVLFEFYRIRERDRARAALETVSCYARNIEAAIVMGSRLFLTLDMPQKPDGFRILDGGGNTIYSRP